MLTLLTYDATFQESTMRYLVLAAALAAAPAAAPAAQQPASPIDQTPEVVALRQCTALADSGKGAEAEAPGNTAASLYRKRLARDPRDVEALVGAARALSQCLVPSAGFLKQGELSSEALELLDQAISLQPDHWLARYVIASISYRSPAFLGRGKRAAKEFDELLRMQRDRTDNPMFARVFAMRGLQLSKDGQADSARALWTRGAALFPRDAELRSLLERVGGPLTPKAPPPESAASAQALGAVQVSATSAPRAAPLPSIKEVSRSQVLLTAGGAADVLQSVQMQPGATRVGEGGDVYTRGGDASETALIVNGARVLSLARFEGLNGSMFGAIEPFVVKTVRYSSGGFSARHGNALSGVLEIETDGRPRERQTRAGVSLVQASGTFRAPTGRRSGGWISGRVSHTGALLETHGRGDEFSGAPHSQEMIGSFVMAPTPLTEVRATAIVERDESRRLMTAAGWRGSFDSRGDTRAVLLSSRWMASSAPVVVRGSVSGSSRSNDWSFGVLARDRDESGAAARVDAEWQARDALMLRAGAEQGSHLRAEAGSVPTTASVAAGAPVRVLGDERSSANQVGAYTEVELMHGRVSVIAGMRADRLPGEREVTADPRVALAVRHGAWTSRLSGGVFHQGRWRGNAAIPDAGTPSGMPLTARHLVLGVERDGASGFVRVESYLKSYDDYREFGAGPAIAGSLSRGVDLIAQRTSGRITGFLGYSLLDATSRLATGERVRSSFDVTHTATGSLTAGLGDWSVGSTVRFGTGAPRTPITGGQTMPDGRTEPIYGALMGERLPAYARVDARVMRYLRFPGVLVTSFLEVLNAGNRPNVATFTYDPTYTSREPVHTFFSRRTLVMGAELMFR
jgi:vitamin B12 transporter